jgi:hypothetical protein
MKTITLNNNIRRVTDNEARALVKSGWKYCTKSEWKKDHKASTANPVYVSTELSGERVTERLQKHKDNSRGRDKKSKYAKSATKDNKEKSVEVK